MSKKFDLFTVENIGDKWRYGISIQEIREDLDRLEKMGATDIEFCVSWSYDDPYVDIWATSYREETDEEYECRVKKEIARNEEIMKSELEQLRKLKEKYER